MLSAQVRETISRCPIRRKDEADALSTGGFSVRKPGNREEGMTDQQTADVTTDAWDDFVRAIGPRKLVVRDFINATTPITNASFWPADRVRVRALRRLSARGTGVAAGTTRIDARGLHRR